MPLEALILRRVFPVPVTFADLMQAACDDTSEPPFFESPWTHVRNGDYPELRSAIMTWWHAAIKEATGALDEVYAIIDGREVRVAIVRDSSSLSTGIVWADEASEIRYSNLNRIIIAADEAGYWQRPHEVRVDLEESQMSHKTMARIAANSVMVSNACGAKVGKTPMGSK